MIPLPHLPINSSYRATSSLLNTFFLSSWITLLFLIWCIGLASGQDTTQSRICTTCETPSGLKAAEIGDDQVTLSWNPVPGYECYYLEYRIAGQISWEGIQVCDVFYTISDADPCAEYEARIATISNDPDDSTNQNGRTDSASTQAGGRDEVLVISPVSFPIFFKTKLPKLKLPVITTKFVRYQGEGTQRDSERNGTQGGSTQAIAEAQVLHICPGDEAAIEAEIEPGKCRVAEITWYRLEQLPNGSWGNRMRIKPCPDDGICSEGAELHNIHGATANHNYLFEAEVTYQCPCGSRTQSTRLSCGINVKCCSNCR